MSTKKGLNEREREREREREGEREFKVEERRNIRLSLLWIGFFAFLSECISESSDFAERKAFSGGGGGIDRKMQSTRGIYYIKSPLSF